MIWMCSIKAHRGSRSVRCLLFSLSSPQHVLPSHPQPEACFHSASSAKPLIRQGGSYCIRLGSLYWLPYSHQSGFVLWLWIICKGSLFSGVFSGNWKDHDKQVACDFFFFFSALPLWYAIVSVAVLLFRKPSCHNHLLASVLLKKQCRKTSAPSLALQWKVTLMRTAKKE